MSIAYSALPVEPENTYPAPGLHDETRKQISFIYTSPFLI